MKRLIYILPLLALLATGCYNKPYADGRISPSPAYVGEDIEFTNLSDYAKSVEWDFDDGTSSSMQNVIHFYYDPGTYNVTLRAFGKKNDVNTAYFIVDVVGSELKVIVKDYDNDALIPDASVLLFASEDDWYEGDYSKAVDEQFTDRYGECFFSGLSYQKYYVDVLQRYENSTSGYVNWKLGDEDIGWVETQLLEGGYDYTFIAYVDYVTFNDKKGTGQAMRPEVRPPLMDFRMAEEKSAGNRPVKENKFSVKRESK